MDNFLRGLITEWRRLELPFADATLVAAVSGGADSVALLLALNELRRRKKLDLRIVAAHFDHNLRGESSRSDLEFVRRLTVDRKIELVHSEWDRTPGANIEEQAREARYAFLFEKAADLKADIIVTGHTMNDQAETVLMNLIRGSGLNGIAGIRPTRTVESEVDHSADPSDLLPFPDPTVLIVRPLLRWAKRSDTEAFCRENNVDFCLDPMNEDITFRRVWIRKVVIPMLEEANPKLVEALCRTAQILQDQPFSDELGPKQGEAQVPEQLSIRELTPLDRRALHTIIRKWLKVKHGSLRGLELKHIEAIERLVHSHKSGRTVELPKNTVVTKSRGKLSYGKIEVDN